MDDIDIEKIAIIGMAGRFPDADNISQFWQNLINGKESLTNYTDEELLSAGENPETIKHPNYVKTGTILTNAEMFDAAFFDFSPKEALYTNPQQRLFLEICWEAMENSGYRADNHPGAIGVYGGSSNNGYAMLLYQQSQNPVSPTDRFQIMMGNDPDFLATRVAYKLNLKGPALTIQTACSTSLVAIHQACQGLLTYQCDMALSGGVCVHLHQGRGYLYQEGMIFSPDGHCRTFDTQAQGTVFGQGAGVVVLKRLSEALADNDTILAVISGSAINNDGAMKVGITAPSVEGQAEVISMAQAIAEVEADSISYIEAHGTGTPLGDPIEIEGLTRSFRETTDKKSFCAIGSVKTNIGHLDAAAGVCGLIKTTLALNHKQIPPSLHYSKANPNINFTDSPFYVNGIRQDWKSSHNQPRRAGVSSFGIGGTNAHAILEEAPVRPATISDTSWQLLPLSARSSTALQTMTTNLAEHIISNPEQELVDIAYTLQVGRKPFQHRCFTVCPTKQNGAAILQNSIKDQYYSICPETQPSGIVFMFSGQGSQYINMTRDLYDSVPFYTEQVDYCAGKLQIELGLDIRDILFPTQEYNAQAEILLRQTNITQPALFLIEYCLAQLWMHWGIKPAAMVGHSIGEYVAACLAGVFSLDDALKLVATRGRLMHSLPPGSMLTIAQSAEEIREHLPPELSLAVINGARRCVVSGTKEHIEQLQKKLDTDEIDSQTLHTSHAFHSHLMEPILDEFTDAVTQAHRGPAQIPFVSNVTGTWITETEASDPGYWANHLRQTVNFYGCLQTLLESQTDILLEIGPGQTLTFLGKQHPKKNKKHIIVATTRRPVERKNDKQVILQSLGQLWLAGVKIDWQQVHTAGTRSRIPLPTYPFERNKFCIAGDPFLPEIEEEPIDDELLSDYDNNEIEKSAHEVEVLVAEIWKKLLVGVKTINREDNFFDLGGDSLQAVQMFSELENETDLKLPLSAIYDTPVLQDFAQLVQSATHPDESDDGTSIACTCSQPTKPVPIALTPFIVIKKLVKLARRPLSAFNLLKKILLGTYCICWYRLFKRNVRIKFPFFASTKIKITGPGSVFIDSGCTTAINSIDHPTIVTLYPDSVITIGKDCSLAGMTIRCKNNITIGDRTWLPGALIQDFLFYSNPDITLDKKIANNAPITIGNDVWLAMQSAILPGSSVNDGAVLGVQAVLYNSSIATLCFAYGNPITQIIPINVITHKKNGLKS